MSEKDKARWTRLVADWESSDLTQREYAQKRGITIHALRYWIYRLLTLLRWISRGRVVRARRQRTMWYTVLLWGKLDMNRALDAFTLPICLAQPRRNDALSAWTEHIPFAMNLVALLRPEVLVELGTQAGDSYCAFCQAVLESNLPTRCFAVSACQGDTLSRSCGPEALAELRAHHDPLYGGFSCLMQSAFDEAAAAFANGSIDLLHIDAIRTSEEARRVFDTWLPKLSERAVVLLHGIRARERNLGVAQAWRELSARYPSFEFIHGHGLGVLSIGAHPPDTLRPLLQATEDERTMIRSFYFQLGRRGVLEYESQRYGTLLANAHQEVFVVRKETAAIQAARDAAEAQVSALETELASAKSALDRQSATLNALAQSVVWRVASSYWRLRDRLLVPGSGMRRAFDCTILWLRGKKISGPGAPPVATPAAAPVNLLTDAAQYALWLQRNQLGSEAVGKLRASSAQLGYRPLVSVLTPVYNIDEVWLRRCIESVLEQAYDQWELCLVDDGSTKPHVEKVLAEYAALDSRIRIARHEQNAGIIAASATALKMARGEYVALLDHDDELSPDALFETVAALQERREADFIYSDEDKLDESGRRVDPFFKPDWSPNLLLSMNYVCHLTVIQRALLEKVGGFRPGFEGSQDYDLLLRVGDCARHVVHIPKVLYHWRKVPNSAASERTAKPYALESGRRAIADALERRGMAGSVVMTFPGTYRVIHAIPDPLLVSIIIPTRDRVGLLRTCVSSIERKTTYRNYELIIIDNESSDTNTLRYLEKLEKRHRVLQYHEPFNWSAINNFAVRHAKGQLLLFMNNDMEIIEPTWLEALIEHAQRPEVGAVGAKLLYPDGRMQHAGVVLGIGGVAGHAFKYLPGDGHGYFHLPQVVREMSAVTGACMMVRRDVFDEIGGFDEQLRVAFNDIDFCLKLRDAGKLVIYTPYSVLFHHESASRGAHHPPEDEALMKDRWAVALAHDPYYSPHLSREVEDYRLCIS